MRLKLDQDINTDFVRFKVQRRLDRKPHSWKTFEEFLVDVYIHEHSNYEKVMWSFWKRSKRFCMKEVESLLMQISTLEKDLTWECLDILKRYEESYEDHHSRSKFVNDITDDDINNLSLFREVA